ncbi:MAG: TatD family hydrolase [Treponema sp.]|nr:TatD family hydrolase [Treponema sp.]
MLTDAHCHPYDLAQVFSESEAERNRLGVLAAASACTLEEFLHNETLPNVLPCFGIHPQMLKVNMQIPSHSPAAKLPAGTETQSTQRLIKENIETLIKLAREKRIAAIGECGFDLFNEFKATETEQEEIFAVHLETAIKHDLPVVLHVRRALHKIFAVSKTLKKCKAVAFHSWNGTYEEALSLLNNGINAYFSFGNIIMLNHKKAIKSCALLPLERILTETDAPYQMRREEKFSRWTDLPLILETAAALRTQAGNKTDVKELESKIEINFRKVFY